MFKQIYFGLLISSSLLGTVGLIQSQHTTGWIQKLAATVGIGGAATALTSLGLGIAYDGKNNAVERDYEQKLEDNNRLKDREASNLKLEINELKSQIKVLETDKDAYAKQISELQQKLNDKAEQYLKVVAEKDLQIKTLQASVDAKDTRIEDFLEDCRGYVSNFFSLRYNDIHNLQKLLENAYDNSDVKDEARKSFETRINDIKKLKAELTEELKVIKELDITDFGVILDHIFTFDNKFLNIKTRWKDVRSREIKAESKELRKSLDNSMPRDVALERFRAGMDEVDAKITEKYETLLLNNNSIHAQLLDLLEQRNLVIDELQKENTELKKPLLAVGTSSYALTANKVAMYYYNNYGYKLDFINWAETDTGYTITFAIRKNPGLTDAELMPDNTQEQLAALCGALVGTLPKFEYNYQNCSVTLHVTLRKVIKKEQTAEDIFRECGVIRSSLFGQTIRKYHIDKTGKPTLRVMSATGGGKGIAVKNLVDYYLQNLDGYEIWLSDPQDGSDEDHWDCDKTATSPSEATALFTRYADLLRSRDAKTSTDPNIPIIGIFDEFDKKHSREDKKTASEIWTTIRHHNMRLVLVGQSSEVGKNGWQWDEMTNCCLLFINNAIDTFIKHADKDLGMNSEALNKFESNYNKAKAWVNKANEDIEPENQYRLAALYCNGVALLLEIPQAHKGKLSDCKSWVALEPFKKAKQMSTSTQKLLISNILKEVNTTANSLVVPELLNSVLQCPDCETPNPKSKGNRWVCVNSDCGRTWVKNPKA